MQIIQFQALNIEIMRHTLIKFKEHSNILLPAIHKIWPSLMNKLRDINKILLRTSSASSARPLMMRSNSNKYSGGNSSLMLGNASRGEGILLSDSSLSSSLSSSLGSGPQTPVRDGSTSIASFSFSGSNSNNNSSVRPSSLLALDESAYSGPAVLGTHKLAPAESANSSIRDSDYSTSDASYNYNNDHDQNNNHASELKMSRRVLNALPHLLVRLCSLFITYYIFLQQYFFRLII